LFFDFVENAKLKNYDITRRFEATAGTTEVVVITPGNFDKQTFVSDSLDDYIVFNEATEEIIVPTEIDITNSAKTIELTFDPQDISNNDNIVVVATRIGVTETEQVNRLKTKELEEETESIDVTLNTDGTIDTVVLEYYDVYRITSIIHNGIQLIDKFNFDDGQRDNFYDFGRVSLKAGQTIESPDENTDGTITLEIKYDYFKWSGSGDYFTVDSYEDDYEKIPNFQSSIHKLVSLRDCIDFRPGITEDTLGVVSFEETIPLSPKSDTFTFLDFSYYLPRIDKIYIDQYGYIGVAEGIPELLPKAPRDVDDTMTLYVLKIAPYTFSPRGALPKLIDNRRFTMKDIGKLEKRIDKLEYYTSLSLLENSLFSKQIFDDSGVEEFKNGFLVDNFTGHGLGDTSNPEYTAAMDFDKGELRPGFFMDSVPLQFEEQVITTPNQSPAELNAENVVLKGNNLMLAYDQIEEKTLTQDQFTYEQPLNPFNVKNWIGSIELSPSSDTWIETNNLEGITSINTSQFDPEQFGTDSELILGTVWNSWEKFSLGESAEKEDDVSSNELNNNDFTYEILGDNNTIAIGLDSTVERRTGLETILSPGTEKTIGKFEKIKNISVIPKIRSRVITFFATGLKPNTIFYPYFDGVDVTNYCQQYESRNHIPFTLFVTKPHTNGPVPIFRFGENDFNHPLIVSGGGSTAGDAVNDVEFINGVAPEYILDSDIKDDFGIRPPGAQLRVDRTGTPVLPRPSLVSNSKGEIRGTFLIPSNALISFRTGNKKFQLRSDDSSKAAAASWAEASYYANGLLQTKGITEITTVPMEIASREVEEFDRSLKSQGIDRTNSIIKPPVGIPPEQQRSSPDSPTNPSGSTPLEQVLFAAEDTGNNILSNQLTQDYYAANINEFFADPRPDPIYSVVNNHIPTLPARGRGRFFQRNPGLRSLIELVNPALLQ